jgi:hypothetical protein
MLSFGNSITVRTMAMHHPILLSFGMLCLGCSEQAQNNQEPLPKDRYHADWSEGIDFRRAGYPDFLEEVSGMSEYEKTHRWTEGPRAVFKFKVTLPRSILLEIDGYAFANNAVEPTKVKIGTGSADVNFSNYAGAKPYYVRLYNPTDSQTLEIIPSKPAAPHDVNPALKDMRKLGIALKKIRIMTPFEFFYEQVTHDPGTYFASKFAVLRQGWLGLEMKMKRSLHLVPEHPQHPPYNKQSRFQEQHRQHYSPQQGRGAN